MEKCLFIIVFQKRGLNAIKEELRFALSTCLVDHRNFSAPSSVNLVKIRV